MSKQIKAVLIQIDEMDLIKDVFAVTTRGNPVPKNKKRLELAHLVQETELLANATTIGALLILTLK